MVTYLFISGLVSLIFGILFLIAPARFWERFGTVVNRPVLQVERKIRPYNFPVGFIFLIIGTWLIFLVLGEPEFWYLHIFGIVLVLVGLLYIFVPDWLLWLSSMSGKEIITFDEIAIASRISLGIVLILVSIYIFMKISVVLQLMR
jgi:hypothetical protein